MVSSVQYHLIDASSSTRLISFGEAEGTLVKLYKRTAEGGCFLHVQRATHPSVLEEASRKVGLFVNPDKCKVMTTSTWNDRSDIQAAGMDLEAVGDFCYVCSYISYNGSQEKDVRVRIGKAMAVFGKMSGVWKSSKISLRLKMQLYESVILSTLPYSTELWPLTTLLKRLDAAHHGWQRSILSILSVSWKDNKQGSQGKNQTIQHCKHSQ